MNEIGWQNTTIKLVACSVFKERTIVYDEKYNVSSLNTVEEFKQNIE